MGKVVSVRLMLTAITFIAVVAGVSFALWISLCPAEICMAKDGAGPSGENGEAVASTQSSNGNCNNSNTFERLHFGIRYSLPDGFVEAPNDKLSQSDGLYTIEYKPTDGRDIVIVMQNVNYRNKETGEPSSAEWILNELAWQSGRMQNTFDLKGDGRKFLRYVSEGEVEIAGVRSQKTAYDYLTSDSEARRSS